MQDIPPREPHAICAACGMHAAVFDLQPKFNRPRSNTFVGLHPCADTGYGVVSITSWVKPLRQNGVDRPRSMMWRVREEWATLFMDGAPVAGLVNTVSWEPFSIGVLVALTRPKDALPRDQLLVRRHLFNPRRTSGSFTTCFATRSDFEEAVLSPMPTDAQMFAWAEVVYVDEESRAWIPPSQVPFSTDEIDHILAATNRKELSP